MEECIFFNFFFIINLKQSEGKKTAFSTTDLLIEIYLLRPSQYAKFHTNWYTTEFFYWKKKKYRFNYWLNAVKRSK